MYTTARLIVTAAALAACLGTAACTGENPAASTPTNARFDSGVTLGGGGRSDTNPPPPDSTQARGGGTFGSGG